MRKIMGGNLARLMGVDGRDRPSSTIRAAPAERRGRCRAVAAARFGDRRPVVDGDAASPTGSWSSEARRFGAALVAAGIEPGDRVAIWAPNSAEWIVAVLGIFEAGATLVPINTRFKGAEAAEILARSGARALVTVTDFLGIDYVAMLAGTGVELPASPPPWSPTARRDRARPAGTSSSAAPTDDDLAEADASAVAVGTDDVSDILFTSGTTGITQGRRADPRPHPAASPPTGSR